MQTFFDTFGGIVRYTHYPERSRRIKSGTVEWVDLYVCNYPDYSGVDLVMGIFNLKIYSVPSERIRSSAVHCILG
jgi:hypothetical protein